MSTPTTLSTPSTPVRCPDRIAGACLVLGGLAFFAGGAMHPGGGGTGSKVAPAARDARRQQVVSVAHAAAGR